MSATRGASRCRSIGTKYFSVMGLAWCVERRSYLDAVFHRLKVGARSAHDRASRSCTLGQLPARYFWDFTEFATAFGAPTTRASRLRAPPARPMAQPQPDLAALLGGCTVSGRHVGHEATTDCHKLVRTDCGGVVAQRRDHLELVRVAGCDVCTRARIGYFCPGGGTNG